MESACRPWRIFSLLFLFVVLFLLPFNTYNILSVCFSLRVTHSMPFDSHICRVFLSLTFVRVFFPFPLERLGCGLVSGRWGVWMDRKRRFPVGSAWPTWFVGSVSRRSFASSRIPFYLPFFFTFSFFFFLLFSLFSAVFSSCLFAPNRTPIMFYLERTMQNIPERNALLGPCLASVSQQRGATAVRKSLNSFAYCLDWHITGVL